MFEFSLAETLGMTVDELREMPSREFAQWYAYARYKMQREELAQAKANAKGRRR